MKYKVPLIILFIAIYNAEALSCERCNETSCDDKAVANCSGSKVKGPCGCCDRCAKQNGEECGGPWDAVGRCDYGQACLAYPFEPPSTTANPGEAVFEYVDIHFDQRYGECQEYYDDCWDACEDMRPADDRPIAFSVNGRSAVFRNNRTRRGYSAYCDCTSGDGEGWMIIQRRTNVSENFDRYWIEYRTGFGNSDGDYWLGLDVLNQLTESRSHELQIKAKYSDGNEVERRYGIIRVKGEEFHYQISFESNAEEGSQPFAQMHNGMKFSTRDFDNDNWKGGSCSSWFRGGWWFDRCTEFNLNGVYYPDHPFDIGPDRITGPGSSHTAEMVEMRIRPTSPIELIDGSGFAP